MMSKYFGQIFSSVFSYIESKVVDKTDVDQKLTGICAGFWFLLVLHVCWNQMMMFQRFTALSISTQHLHDTTLV